MSDKEIIKNFDKFLALNESLADGYQSRLNNVFRNLKIIKFEDGNTVTPDEVIDVVEKAIDYLRLDFPRTFYFANKTMNIIYLAHSKEYDTMAVDKNMNLYMNVGYVYHTLKMDPELIAAVIMHEVFHVTYDHIERGKNWLAAKGKPVNRANWHDTNLAADVEVNQTLTKSGIISEERLINEIRGIYLGNANKGGKHTVVPMEEILNDDEYMEILRRMSPPEDDPEYGPRIETTKDWDSGYKEMWNKLVPLIKKFGWQGIWDKLQESELINSAGEVISNDTDFIKKSLDDFDVDTTMAFIQVKSFEDFINESTTGDVKNSGGKDDLGKTYENGYMTAFNVLVNTINSVLNNNGGGGGGGPTSPKIDSELKDDDLEELKLPPKENNDDDNDGDGDDNGLPGNVKQEQQPQQNKNQKNKPKKSSSGDGDDSGDEDSDEKDAKDASKMIDNLKKRLEKEQAQGSGDEGEGENQEGAEDGEGENSGVSTDGENQHDPNSKRKPGKSTNSEYTDDGEAFSPFGNDKNDKQQSSSDGDSAGANSFVDDDDIPDNAALKESGYTDEDIKELNEIRKVNAQKNSPERLRKVLNDYRNQLERGDFIGKLLDTIDVESRKYKNIWEDILKRFLGKKTRRAGKDVNAGHNDWKNKKKIALGDYGIHRQKIAQDPQDVNLYVDVSGSMNEELLEIIAKSLVIMTEQYQYSGLNICPWGTRSGGVFKIESIKESNKDKVVKDIMGAISLGRSKAGCSTEADAAMSAIVSCMEENLKDPRKKAKDDVHIVITDGEVSGFSGIESDLERYMYEALNRRDVASRVPKNTFWMIYDASEGLRDEWENEIKNGTLIFINSQTVINNKKR